MQAARQTVGHHRHESDMAGKFVEYGFSWVAVGSDMGYVVSRGQEYLAKMREYASAAPKSQSAH